MFWEKEGEKEISNSRLVNNLNVDEVQIIAFPMVLCLFATCSIDDIPSYADIYEKPLEKQFQWLPQKKAPSCFPAPTSRSVSDQSKITGWGV